MPYNKPTKAVKRRELHRSVRFSLLLVLLSFLPSTFYSQTVFQNITATCGTPITFQDPGGAGNYTANLHYVYTICPGDPTKYASVSLTGINLGNNDNILVVNGSSSQDPYIRTITGSPANMTITSSSQDHCLTLIFSSDGTNHGSGWGGSINCANSAGSNVNICQETDCVGGCARTVCGSGVYTWQNSGTNMIDLNNINAGCLTAHAPELERNHVWYYINPQSPGTLEVLIESGAGGQIYDYALWSSFGETVSCPAFTGDDPISCEAENNGSNGTTPQGSGFSSSEWIDSDNPGHLPYSAYPGYEPAITITQAQIDAGIVFMLLINVRSNGTPQPVVNITMDGTASLDCTPLAVELVDFFGIQKENYNELHWITQSEQNNSHFIVERSHNALDWEYEGIVYGAGNSTESLNYRLEDMDPHFPLTYYRLKQVDMDGQITQYKTISLVTEISGEEWIASIFPNPSDTYINLIHNDPDTEHPLIVELFNDLGQLVLQHTVVIEEKDQAFSVSTAEQPAGVYTIRCMQGDKILIKKLVIH